MFPSTQVNTGDLRSALQHSQVQETNNNAGVAFMQFDYITGNFYFGREKEEITGEEIVINIASFKHGWTLWVDGKSEKLSVPFTQPLPQPMEGREDRDGDFCEPGESRSFEARFLDDDETILRFDSNSYGGRKGCDSVLTSVKLKASVEEDNFLFPIVKLDNESYEGKKGRTIHNPVFTIVGWMDAEGNRDSDTQKLEAPAEEVKEETPAPKRRRRKA